jgi:DNA primase
MSRIPKQFIDDLLARIDIVDVVDTHVPLKKSGANYTACCPFHNEKTPSFTVSQPKQFYHCFGCGAHGTAISFLMEYERLSFPEAIESLAHTLGMEVPREGGEREQREDFEPLYTVLNRADNWFRQQLRSSSEAIDYLKKRGISGKTAADFGIGYAPAGWDNLVSQLSEAEKHHSTAAGLTGKRENGGLYDRFRKRIMFPIHNRRGRVIGFGGRVIDPEDEPKYLNSPETAVFHKGSELYGLYRVSQLHRQLKDLLVVEGYMDVVMLAEHGIDNAVATLGTATTTEHLHNLFRASTEITFCFDGDSAGHKAAWRAFEISLPELLDHHQIKFLFLPDGEDPDSMVQKEGNAAFLARIKGAATLPDYFLSELRKRFGASSLQGRVQRADFALPYLESINATILRNLLKTKVEDELGLEGKQLLRGSNKSAIQRTEGFQQRLTKRFKLEMNDIRLAVATLLAQPSLAGEVDNLEQLATLRQAGMPLLIELINQLRTEPNLNTAQLLERYRDRSEDSALNRLAMYEFPNPDNEVDLLKKVFHDALRQLRRKAREQRYDDLLRKPRDQLTSAELEEIQAYKGN